MEGRLRSSLASLPAKKAGSRKRFTVRAVFEQVEWDLNKTGAALGVCLGISGVYDRGGNRCSSKPRPPYPARTPASAATMNAQSRETAVPPKGERHCLTVLFA